jgi:hypothetical protein
MAGHLIESTPRRVGAAFSGLRGRVLTSVLYSGVIAAAVVAVIAAVIFFVGAKPAGGEVVTSATIGDCVTVHDGTASGAACDALATTFVVAQRLAAGGNCTSPSYLKVNGETGTLCVAPNLTVGSCYAVGGGFPATADVRRVDCPSGLSARGAGDMVRVTERAIGGPMNCRGLTAVDFDLPEQFGYCVTPIN